MPKHFPHCCSPEQQPGFPSCQAASMNPAFSKAGHVGESKIVGMLMNFGKGNLKNEFSSARLAVDFNCHGLNRG